MSWGVVATVGATVAGAAIGSSATRSAASQQADATAAAQAENARQYDTTRADYAPYREAGVKALGQLDTEMGQAITPADVMSDPGYQFGLTQGQTALDRKTAAAGGRVSGAALKAASEYGTNYATTGYNAAYQRRQDRLNRLQSLAGIGQTATGSSAAAGDAAASRNSALISAQGNAGAAATMAQGNSWGNTINQLGAAGQRWASGSGGYTNQGVANANGLTAMDIYSGF